MQNLISASVYSIISSCFVWSHVSSVTLIPGDTSLSYCHDIDIVRPGLVTRIYHSAGTWSPLTAGDTRLTLWTMELLVQGKFLLTG